MARRYFVLASAALFTLLVVPSPALRAAEPVFEWNGACEYGGAGTTPESAVEGIRALIKTARMTGPRLAEEYGRLGCAYLALNQTDKAIESFTAAHGIVPTDGYGRKRARAYARAGQYAEAAADLAADEATARSHPWMLLAQGALKIKANDTDGARGALDRYVALVPEDPRGYHNLGVLHERLGEAGKAAAAYCKAMALESGYKPSEAALDALLKSTTCQ